MDVNIGIFEWFRTKIISYIKFWGRYYDLKINKFGNAIWYSEKSTVDIVH